MTVRRSLVLMAAAIAAATTGLVGPAPSAMAASDCPDVELVFARGTDEPPGIGVVGEALVDALKPMVKGKEIRTYGVKYPASYDFLGVATGATDASTRAQKVAKECPKTNIVLGGYSQGAAVMDVVATSPIAGLGFRNPLPAAMDDRINAVAVFGNPSARIGQPLTTLSPRFGAKTADLCNRADPICSLGRDFSSHTRYEESGLVKLAAEWVAKLVKDPPRQS